jgi:hypothetical protein
VLLLTSHIKQQKQVLLWAKPKIQNYQDNYWNKDLYPLKLITSPYGNIGCWPWASWAIFLSITDTQVQHWDTMNLELITQIASSWNIKLTFSKIKKHLQSPSSHEANAFICFIIFLKLVFFLLVGLGFELRTLHLQNRYPTTPPVHFALVIFWDGVSRTICLGWHGTVILQISTSQVARITDVSHWNLALKLLLR